MNQYDPLADGSDAALPPAFAPGGAPFPWPPAENESIVTAFADTWRGATFHARDFFAAMPERGTLSSALLYYLPLGIVVSGINLFWKAVFARNDVETAGPIGELGGLSGINPLVEFLISPLMLLLSLFVAAGVVHLMLRMFGGARHNYGFTTRVFAFAYSPQAFGILPIAGQFVGFVWMVVIAIIGLRAGHRTTTGKAAAAVIIPVTIMAFFMIVAYFVQAAGTLLLRP